MAQIFMFLGHPADCKSSTWVCLNIGSVLARQGKKVLFLDMVDFPCFPLSDWVSPVASGIYEMLQGKSFDIAHRNGKTKWDIVVQGERFYEKWEQILLELENVPQRKGLLHDALRPLDSLYDYIMINGGSTCQYASQMHYEASLRFAAYNNFIAVLPVVASDSDIILTRFLWRYEAIVHQPCPLKAVILTHFNLKPPDFLRNNRLIHDCEEYLAKTVDIMTLDYYSQMEDALRCHQDIFEYAPLARAAMQLKTIAWRHFFEYASSVKAAMQFETMTWRLMRQSCIVDSNEKEDI